MGVQEQLPALQAHPECGNVAAARASVSFPTAT
jgi:hypothetical protein